MFLISAFHVKILPFLYKVVYKQKFNWTIESIIIDSTSCTKSDPKQCIFQKSPILLNTESKNTVYIINDPRILEVQFKINWEVIVNVNTVDTDYNFTSLSYFDAQCFEIDVDALTFLQNICPQKMLHPTMDHLYLKTSLFSFLKKKIIIIHFQE